MRVLGTILVSTNIKRKYLLIKTAPLQAKTNLREYFYHENLSRNNAFGVDFTTCRSLHLSDNVMARTPNRRRNYSNYKVIVLQILKIL